ncbi:thiamine-phosphate kinase [Williamsia sp. 1135]|nr:thiamine-phosphate kinase [Williamsia sp. 1135]
MAERVVRAVSDDPVRTVGDVGELELIDLIAGPESVDGTDTGVLVGPGDDAAVLVGGGPVVVSTDALVEGQHFRLDWSTPIQVGAKAIVANAADVMSMGGRVTGFVVSLTCPKDLGVDTLVGLRDGMRTAAARYGAHVVGGDLTAGCQLVIAVTAIGAMDSRSPVRLSTAREGDVLAVSGQLGASGAGLDLLLAGKAGFPSLVAAHCEPSPNLFLAAGATSAGVHAMTDVSDGLLRELRTMARQSGHAMNVDPTRVPVLPELADAAAALHTDPLRWVLGGGEDHELLASFPPDVVPVGWTVIGTVERRSGGPAVVVTGIDDVDLDAGWRTF